MKKRKTTVIIILLAVCLAALLFQGTMKKSAETFAASKTNAAEEEKESVFSEAKDWSEVFTLKAVYPHNTDFFTEGLFFLNGRLCESTGLEGQSQLCLNIVLDSGVPEAVLKINSSEFGEGSAYYEGYIYLLTYRNGIAYRFDAETPEAFETLDYPREGWGLTSDGTALIAGDGSSTLYFMDRDLNVTKTLDVTYNGEKIERINELEYIEGKIYANIWLESCVAMIDPETGEVEALISFESLLPDETELKSSDSVLNGIAYDEVDGTVYITGKNWPVLYQLEKK